MKNVTLSAGEKLESLNIKDYKIIQSDALYKFTSDSVILSRFAKGGAKRVLDLCSGSGIVSLHYYALHDDGVEKCVCCEIQKELARLNEKSVAVNGLEDKFSVVNVPLQEFECAEPFDLVLCNPPYEKAGACIPPKNDHLAVCRTELAVTLEDIVKTASKSLKRGGALCMCHKASRLQEIFVTLDKYDFNVSRIRFVGSKSDKAYLVLIEALKGKKTETSVYNAIINDFCDFSGE